MRFMVYSEIFDSIKVLQEVGEECFPFPKPGRMFCMSTRPEHSYVCCPLQVIAIETKSQGTCKNCDVLQQIQIWPKHQINKAGYV